MASALFQPSKKSRAEVHQLRARGHVYAPCRMRPRPARTGAIVTFGPTSALLCHSERGPLLAEALRSGAPNGEESHSTTTEVGSTEETPSRTLRAAASATDDLIVARDSPLAQPLGRDKEKKATPDTSLAILVR